MKITFSRGTIFLIAILLTGSLYFTATVTNRVVGQGAVSSDIAPGDTIWYDVTTFDGLDTLIQSDCTDTTCAEFPEGTALTGSIAGSSIFVKVMNNQTEQMDYFDGTLNRTGSLPVVDITGGFMTGSQTQLFIPAVAETCDTYTDYYGYSYETCTSGNPEIDFTLPAGSVLPLPVIFGTATQFGVDGTPTLVLPLPLILNDDYALHEAVMNFVSDEIAANVEADVSLSVENQDGFFALHLSGGNAQDGQGTIDAQWRKSDGLLESFDLDITGQGAEMFHIKIDLKEVNHHGLNLREGDKFSLTVNQAGFDYVVSGFPAEDDPSTDLDNLQGMLSDLTGLVLAEFVVLDIDGLWYEVSGSLYDADTDRMMSINELTEGELDTVWMSGYGTLHMSSSTSTFGLAFAPTSETTYTDCFTDYYGYESCVTVTEVGGPDLGSLKDAELRRVLHLPGFAMTEDYDIYLGYDQTLESVNDLFDSIVRYGIDQGEDTTSLIFNRDHSSTSNDGFYQLDTHFDWDFDTVGEEVDENGNPIVITVASDGVLESTMKYNKFGHFDSSKFQGSFSIMITGGTGEPSLAINNIIFEIIGTLITQDGSEITDTDDGGAIEAPNPLPGFGIIFALLSVTSLVLLRRFRK